MASAQRSGAAALLSAQTLFWSKTVDPVLDGEQDIDAVGRLGRDRRIRSAAFIRRNEGPPIQPPPNTMRAV